VSTPFDRATLRRRRDRAAGNLGDFDFLLREVGERLLDRLGDVRRSFPLAADLGCHTGQLAAMLGGRGGIETLVSCDLSERMTAVALPPAIVCDEELLPFADASLDLVLSSFSLHWINDLPGALVQIRRALKPDGLFLAAMAGGETLKELRWALSEAEIAEEGGLSPRVSPVADVRDMGDLLGRAGFALPVADSETITVSYADPLRLLADLRGMGESNAVAERRRTPLRRATLTAAAARYRDRFGDGEGRVPATFQIVYLTGWAPHAQQPKALRPGSARARLADALGSPEIPAGDKARPH
jgi:SAM-dependent methyltransferase